jgi:hypothetical protein
MLTPARRRPPPRGGGCPAGHSGCPGAAPSSPRPRARGHAQAGEPGGVGAGPGGERAAAMEPSAGGMDRPSRWGHALVHGDAGRVRPTPEGERSSRLPAGGSGDDRGSVRGHRAPPPARSRRDPGVRAPGCPAGACVSETAAQGRRRAAPRACGPAVRTAGCWAGGDCGWQVSGVRDVSSDGPRVNVPWQLTGWRFSRAVGSPIKTRGRSRTAAQAELLAKLLTLWPAAAQTGGRTRRIADLARAKGGSSLTTGHLAGRLFPRLLSRGPIEARPHAPSTRKRTWFPRLLSRGPIEATTRGAAPHMGDGFRDYLVAAPLKPADLGRRPRRRLTVSATT